jgi:hypothetical protein
MHTNKTTEQEKLGRGCIQEKTKNFEHYVQTF